MWIFSKKKKTITEENKSNLTDIPNVIYKYRDWNNKYHKSILEENSLYMANASAFNDPFDCKISTNFHLLDCDEKRQQFINDSITQNIDHILANNIDVAQHRITLGNRLKDIDTFQKFSDDIEFSKNNDHIGILSMSARWNSILMWSHYGNFHQGFCVGFSEEKMRNSPLFGKCGLVNYVLDFPVYTPFEDKEDKERQQMKVFYKSTEWKYEEEYRLVNMYVGIPFPKQDRTVKISDDFIVEINLGIGISDQHKKELLKIAAEKNIEVYQLSKVPFRYELERKRIL